MNKICDDTNVCQAPFLNWKVTELEAENAALKEGGPIAEVYMDDWVNLVPLYKLPEDEK